MRWWLWFLRGTWAIIRTGGSPRLVLADIAAGIRWAKRRRNQQA